MTRSRGISLAATPSDVEVWEAAVKADPDLTPDERAVALAIAAQLRAGHTASGCR